MRKILTTIRIGFTLMSGLVTAILNAKDIEEIAELFGISIQWSLLTFLLFLVFVIWWIGDLEWYKYRREHSKPNVVYESPEALMYNNACWVRLIFRNKVVHPSGDISTSQDTRAKIEVYSTAGILLDAWNGRWSDSGWPTDYGDIDNKNKWTINANNTAKLDIGRRVVEEVQFKGHYNRTAESPEPPRKPLDPDSYYVRVELRASNMGVKEFWFNLHIPNEPQLNDPNQVQIKPISQRPAIHKVNSQT